MAEVLNNASAFTLPVFRSAISRARYPHHRDPDEDEFLGCFGQDMVCHCLNCLPFTPDDGAVELGAEFVNDRLPQAGIGTQGRKHN